MCRIEVYTPDDETDDDELIQYRLVKKSYKVDITLVESFWELRLISLYTGYVIYDSEMWEIAPDWVYEKYERYTHSDEKRVT